MRVYLRLLAFLRPYRVRVACAVVAALVFAGASALYAFLIGPLLKVLLTGESAGSSYPLLSGLSQEQLVTALPLALVMAAVLRAGAQALQNWLMQSAGQRIISDLRRSLFARFLALPQAWHGRRHSGDLLSRFGADVQAVEYSLTQAFSSYVKDALMVLVMLGFCARLDWRLFLAAMAVVPLAALPLARFARGLKRVSDQCQAALGSLAGQVGEAIDNVRVVQAFAREEGELERLDASQGRYLRLMRTSFLLRAGFSPVVEMLGVLGVAAAIFFAGRAIAQGQLSGDTLLSFIAALMLMYRPVKELAITGQLVIQGMSAASRLFEVLDAPDRLPEPAEAPAPVFEREVAFRGLGFSYGEKPVLRDVDLVLPKGKTVALVGESGSGKSTLAALLLRFYDPTAGAVEIDGRDLRTMRLDDLRRLVAFVSQEPVLFAGTVRENLTCGRAGTTDEALIAALQAAHAWDFVERLPGGLDALVGERGAGLSGGQRQRLAIARALLTDAPIILLDEATSALDNVSEALVQQGLDRLLQRRTALVIAHRLTTVERADLICVLGGGGIVERGTHRELLAAGGAYARLWRAQMEEAVGAAGEKLEPAA